MLNSMSIVKVGFGVDLRGKNVILLLVKVGNNESD